MVSSDREANRRTTPSANGKHALVIGGGVSGLCAAHSLSRAFDQVSLLDARPPGARAVPAGNLTVLPARARRELEWLMPGADDRLQTKGARVLEASAPGVALSDHGSSFVFPLQCASDVLFRTLDAALADRANVTVLHRTRARALRFGSGCFSRVTGVEATRTSAERHCAPHHFDLDAQLVVDATGPDSPLSRPHAKESSEASTLAMEIQPAHWAARRLFERGPALPDGLAPVGSSVFAVPHEIALRVLISALSARALEETLAVSRPCAPGFTDRFLRTQSTRHDEVWHWLASRVDNMHPTPMFDLEATRGGYLRALRRAADRDDGLRQLLHRSDQLIDPVELLFQPSVVWRVLRANRRQRVSPAQDEWADSA